MLINRILICFKTLRNTKIYAYTYLFTNLPNKQVETEEDGQETWDPAEQILDILTEVYSVMHILGPWSAGFIAQAMSKQLVKQEAMLSEDGTRLMRFCLAKLKMIYLLVERFYEKEVCIFFVRCIGQKCVGCILFHPHAALIIDKISVLLSQFTWVNTEAIFDLVIYCKYLSKYLLWVK